MSAPKVIISRHIHHSQFSRDSSSDHNDASMGHDRRTSSRSDINILNFLGFQLFSRSRSLRHAAGVVAWTRPLMKKSR